MYTKYREYTQLTCKIEKQQKQQQHFTTKLFNRSTCWNDEVFVVVCQENKIYHVIVERKKNKLKRKLVQMWPNIKKNTEEKKKKRWSNRGSQMEFVNAYVQRWSL